MAIILLGFLVMIAIAAATQAQDVATEVAGDEAAPGIYLLNGANGFSSNMALMVGAERVLLIDDGMAPISADLMETIVELAGRLGATPSCDSAGPGCESTSEQTAIAPPSSTNGSACASAHSCLLLISRFSVSAWASCPSTWFFIHWP